MSTGLTDSRGIAIRYTENSRLHLTSERSSTKWLTRECVLINCRARSFKPQSPEFPEPDRTEEAAGSPRKSACVYQGREVF